MNQTGFSLIEVLVAAGLSAFIIGLSAMPIVQMKTLEQRVEFQTELSTAHNLALLRARNGTFLKKNLGVAADTPNGLEPSNRGDKCFGGRGTNCLDYQVINWQILDHFDLQMNGGFSATSAVSMLVTCESNQKCNQVTIKVETQPTSTLNSISVRPLKAQFTIPAPALSSRQEIDFSHCVGKVITGINYQTLTAECTAVGTNTCTNMGGTGPILTFGPNVNPNDPTNCQPPVNRSCSEGLAQFGLINGQAQCSTTPVCNDPFSTTCNPAPTLPPCVPNWSPTDASTVCLGDTVPQVDLNGCNPPRTLVGTNVALCSVNNCTYTGAIKWPDPVLGPCSNSGLSLNTAPNSTSSIVNDNLNYHGTLTATCLNNPPAAPDYNWTAARASSSCAPIQCQGVPSSLQWSATRIFDGSPGPWPCSGAVNPSGTLNASQTATANNSAATATAGSIQVTCADPGPVGAPRSGALNYSAPSCTPTSSGYCLYQCVDNFIQNVDGRLEAGETSPETCRFTPAQPSKFYMSCIGYGGASCNVHSTGVAQNVQATCGGLPPPNPCSWVQTSAWGHNTSVPECDSVGYPESLPDCTSSNNGERHSCIGVMSGSAWPTETYTCQCGAVTTTTSTTSTTVGACHANGWETFMSGDNDGNLCSSEGGPDLGPTPNPACCSGYDVALYTLSDTVGGSGGCIRVCGDHVPPNVMGTWKNTGQSACSGLQVCTDYAGNPSASLGGDCRIAVDGGKTCKGNPTTGANCMELTCKP